MKKIIVIDQQNIEYTLRVSKKAKGIRLAVYSDGRFVVTIPKRISEKFTENFISQKSSWVIEKINKSKNNPISKPVQHTDEEITKYKDDLYKKIMDKIKYWNTFYNLKYNKVTIKNIKTRWGSCSSKGNLNFSYRLIFVPEQLLDYVVVHELCHLGEMNHSSKFWKLVEKTIPHHKELRKQLKAII